MEIKIEKKDKENINALQKYKYELIEETNDYIIVDMDNINDIDDYAKETKQGEYCTCKITRYGSTDVKSLFFNHLTDDWENDGTYHADVHYMSDEEVEEYNNDLIVEENATEHPRYSEYQEYCSSWQSSFDSQYAYHNGSSRKAREIMGNSPVSFAEFLKTN